MLKTYIDIVILWFMFILILLLDYYLVMVITVL